ncbi:MAG: PIN domain-containing protein [Gemmataceae bacterium]|nr:PIN domain-containing protein [Gemmataceae bacterium]
MKYLVIDTNIWVRVISQGRPGCEITHLDDLRRLVEESKITLLLPEVVQLELGKHWRSFTETVEIEIGKLEKELDSLLRKQFWTEIEDVQKSLREFLAEQKAKKISAASERFQKVQSLLASPKIIILPFTPDIHFRGRKRLMAGRMPKPENRAHSDACILESLAVFFEHSQKDEHELCFCSENVADFGLAAKDRHIIHPLHKDDLPPATEYCISLEKVIAFFHSEQAAVAPSPDVIREALEQRTEDEVEAEIEMEAERKSDDICAAPNCYAPRFVISRYCFPHYEMHLGRLSPEQREAHDSKLTDVLKTLTYREREILKLRWGFGDGYVYTPSECARIFKLTPQRIGQIEAKALRKLQHPVRRRALDDLL